jgi:transcriptional regulator with XRE-family HTH domain
MKLSAKEKLRRIRERKGLSLRDFADELGICTFAAIHLIETGQRAPGRRIAIELEKKLGIKVEEW